MHILQTPPPPPITSLVVHPLGQHDLVFSSYLSLFPLFSQRQVSFISIQLACQLT